MKKKHDWRELNLQSMDLLLCAGRSGMSKRIQKFQRLTGAPEEADKISHVAAIEAVEDEGTLQVMESTTLNKWAGKKGVQMNWMEDWLRNYDGEVYVRKLDFNRTEFYYIDDQNFWLRHKDDSYESGIPGTLELLLCGLRLNRYVQKVFPSYVPKFTDEPHCTELVAKRVNTHGLWNKTIVPNRMPPWIWWGDEIKKWLKVPISEPICIKA